MGLSKQLHAAQNLLTTLFPLQFAVDALSVGGEGNMWACGGGDKPCLCAYKQTRAKNIK